MNKFARIINSVAVDVSHNPAEQFHPTIAEEFVPVPNEVEAGWKLTGDSWQAPILNPEPTPLFAKVSPVEFKLLFTSSERIAIAAERTTDAIIDDFFSIVDDARLTTVDLGLASTQNGLSYLVGLGLLTAERREEILQGVFQ